MLHVRLTDGNHEPDYPALSPLSAGLAALEHETPDTALDDARPELGELTTEDLDSFQRLATVAHNGTSFTPEERGQQWRADLERHLAAIWSELSKKADTPAKREALAGEYPRFARNTLDKWRQLMEAKGRIISPMITGPANFPVQQNQKRMDREHRLSVEIDEWTNRAIAAIHRKIDGAATPQERTSEAQAMLEERIRHFIASDRSSLFRRNLQGRIERAYRRGESEAVRGALQYAKAVQEQQGITIFAAKNRVWRLAEEIPERESPRSLSGSAEVGTFDGGTISADYDDNRLRIHFDAKPDEAMRTTLKRYGWRWSHSNSAWQRQLTLNARENLSHILAAVSLSSEGGRP